MQGKNLKDYFLKCRLKTIDRFWSRVKKTNKCWNWTGVKNENGYGTLVIGINRDYKTAKAHRLSYLIHKGSLPNHKFVCHKCDNPSCVNPKHLYLGDYASNIKDMYDRGRGITGDKNGSHTHPEKIAKGEMNGQSKLTKYDVSIIRDLHSKGMTYLKIGNKFGVSYSTVGYIIRNKTWKHLL